MTKTAIIGLGKMGLSHVSIANGLDCLDVVAICDKNSMVGSVIEKYGKLSYYSDFDETLAIPGLEAVVVATPSKLHDGMIRAALDRGLHIFAEKPLTLSGAASLALAEIARSKSLVTQVGYHNRFVATFAEVKRLLDIGAIGQVTHVLAEAYGPVVLRPSKATWRTNKEEGGGCLYDYAAHPLNLLNWYFGGPVAVDGAILNSVFSAETEDEVYATIQFPANVSAHLSVNWSDESVRKMTTKISIWGTAGRIYVDRQEVQVFLRHKDSVPEGYNPGWTVKYTTDLTQPVSFYLRGEEYSAQLENFGQAVKEKRLDNLNDFASAAVTDVSLDMIGAAAAGEGGLIGSAVPRRAPGFFERLVGRR